MKVLFDATKCSGYGRCSEVCPSVFEMDEFGYASVLGDGTVPAGDEANAKQAAAECPEKAISIQE
ncbi:MAG: ferredoxin [Alcaligenaceae bacterium]|jgi:ferredoxin|nr:ferredoxin [Alcaligenaceae bacterium]|tara:strand:- start:3575 stop:3769 length:195 start_codon:yes stop_codon:yes gene_type:complete